MALAGGQCMIACVSPCINCTSLSTCLSCVSGYYLSGTSCLTCTSAISNCQICSSDGSSCTLCQQGYTLNTTTPTPINCTQNTPNNPTNNIDSNNIDI